MAGKKLLVVPMVVSMLVSFVSAIGANDRLTVVAKTNTAESILFFATASMLFLVIFIFIHWGIRKK